ncbi:MULTISPECIES: ABC transporter ATP-binding protein/permease [Corynebacterium]|uniref:ABC transporter transmembrane domain-containing protein n=1 Tax=Corynebacterium amycolatum TaxID=43765 RepID=A0AAW9SKQ8_CORAY|nr:MULTISPECIES: ABC transporter transmembrane domain-containing protein [Corynebacterium]MDK7109947.1 ABC transporter transmembrane domain-containing protein [Corynebacterium amycolatum]MDK7146081.1 ABC transporter transmembrane domain-containing protein [Corynebacterium amycolatum]MDK7237418.1 ABC transporter transmembrane domain-containing protein [Corynebacterium amycolatum]MDK7247496.1 ABC transporter transmembrane domain-containing protein [Corynebacterium amycolatum]
MAPVDPKLFKLSAPAWRWVIFAGALTAASTGATIALGLAIGTITAQVLGEATPNWTVFALVATASVLVRVACSYALVRFGQSAGARVATDLRSRALRALALRDPRTVDTAHWRALLSVGLDGVAVYVAEFLPALVAAALATPMALAAVAWLDLPSFAIAVVTLPLIPLFMWLVGRLTEGRTERRLADIGTVRGQILDLVVGLPTLKAHTMADAPSEEIKRLSTRHRKSTMEVLRIAFLSASVLEFLTTLSIALIAVGIGFRLLGGHMTLATGLAVLIIAPEIYGPVRQVGQKFHAAQDGVVAATEVTELLAKDANQTPNSTDTTSEAVEGATEGTSSSSAPSAPTVVFEHLSAPGRDGVRPSNLSAIARPGAVTVLAGPNGVGKTTALLAVAEIVHEDLEGSVTIRDGKRMLHGQDLLQRIAWLPQRPILDAAAVGDNSRRSLGQRQREALRRELADDTRDLVLLDEPTAHLDADSAQSVIRILRTRARRGATVIATSHDPLLIAAADDVVEVQSR